MCLCPHLYASNFRGGWPAQEVSGILCSDPLPAMGKRMMSCDMLYVGLNDFLIGGNGVDQATHIITVKLLHKRCPGILVFLTFIFLKNNAH